MNAKTDCPSEGLTVELIRVTVLAANAASTVDAELARQFLDRAHRQIEALDGLIDTPFSKPQT